MRLHDPLHTTRAENGPASVRHIRPKCTCTSGARPALSPGVAQGTRSLLGGLHTAPLRPARLRRDTCCCTQLHVPDCTATGHARHTEQTHAAARSFTCPTATATEHARHTEQTHAAARSPICPTALRLGKLDHIERKVHAAARSLPRLRSEKVLSTLDMSSRSGRG